MSDIGIMYDRHKYYIRHSFIMSGVGIVFDIVHKIKTRLFPLSPYAY